MKHIKLLYVLTLSVMTGVFLWFQVKTYGNIRNQLVEESLHYNSHFAATTGSRLHETELLLDMMGHQLLDNGLYLNQKKSQAVMAKMLTRFPSVVGFGLTDPKGNYIAVSYREDPSNIKGLKKKTTRQGRVSTGPCKAMQWSSAEFISARSETSGFFH
ncbi:hypothetical protein [Desulfobacter sp.]|jgi:hypothetical protein